jgi:hypothetical protein
MQKRIAEICQALSQKSLDWYRKDELARKIYPSEQDYITQEISHPVFSRQRHVIATLVALAEEGGEGIGEEIRATVVQAVGGGLFDTWYDVLGEANQASSYLGLPLRIDDDYRVRRTTNS